jgi:uncharacterized protein YdeI (YjbR/CyaY-like superfamily)
MSQPKFFRTGAEFRQWLRQHHASAAELLVGFYKTGSGKPSMTWPESVDEALSFGWIDGIRRRVDDQSYTIRFTPRRPGSIWSSKNIKQVAVLIEAKRMMPSGLKAFEARKENKSGVYSYEKRPAELIEPYASLLKRNAAARNFFEQQAPSYRRAATWWVISAKQEETRARRTKTLIELSSQGELIPQFRKRV